MLQLQAAHLLKKRFILGVRTGPTAFDIGHTKGIEALVIANLSAIKTFTPSA